MGGVLPIKINRYPYDKERARGRTQYSYDSMDAPVDIIEEYKQESTALTVLMAQAIKTN